jgi:hypothetical protein
VFILCLYCTAFRWRPRDELITRPRSPTVCEKSRNWVDLMWNLYLSQWWLWRVFASGDITPCSRLKVNRCFGEICPLHLQCRRINQARNQDETAFDTFFTLISCFAYSSRLKIEAIYSSETSANFQRTMRHYSSEDRILEKLINVQLVKKSPIFHGAWNFITIFTSQFSLS